MVLGSQEKTENDVIVGDLEMAQKVSTHVCLIKFILYTIAS